MRHFLTIQTENVGTQYIDGHRLTAVRGIVQPRDVGKRVYVHAHFCQVENDAQFDTRIWKEHEAHRDK